MVSVTLFPGDFDYVRWILVYLFTPWFLAILSLTVLRTFKTLPPRLEQPLRGGVAFLMQNLFEEVLVFLIPVYYVSATLVDDQFHVRLPATTESDEAIDAPVPNTAEAVSMSILNQHVGIANQGTEYLDFSNIENWTWTGIRWRFVRVYMSSIGAPEANIYMDAAALEVRYVPPTGAAIVLWEEL